MMVNQDNQAVSTSLVTGRTQVCFMLGHPVSQAASPALFNASMTKAGRDTVLVPVDLRPSGLPAFFSALRNMDNCKGCVVTYPFKQQAYLEVDDASADCRALGVANVVIRSQDGKLRGEITDGSGFLNALITNGQSVRDRDVLLIGAGGAGAAIALELLRAEAARLVICDIDQTRRQDLINRAASLYPHRPVFSTPPEDFGYDLLCNATPLGMAGDQRLPWPLEGLGQHAFVADIVPYPPETPWIVRARELGLKTQTGPEMVAGQIDAIASLLTGRTVP